MMAGCTFATAGAWQPLQYIQLNRILFSADLEFRRVRVGSAARDGSGRGCGRRSCRPVAVRASWRTRGAVGLDGGRRACDLPDIRGSAWARTAAQAFGQSTAGGGVPRGFTVPRGLLVPIPAGLSGPSLPRGEEYASLPRPRPAPGLGAFRPLLEEALVGQRILRHESSHPQRRTSFMARHVHLGVSDSSQLAAIVHRSGGWTP